MFVDDFTKFSWIYPMKLKSQAYSIFIQFKTLVEKQLDLPLKGLQTDWGGEFRKLQPLLQRLGIIFRHPCPHTHPQQGRVERKHRHVTEM